MKNVTLSIDDQVLERARKIAAERGTSVNQMIRDYLARETPTETEDAYRARMALVDLAKKSHRGMIGEWDREEAYAERFSRYERADLRGDIGDDASSQVEGRGGDNGRN
jgi:hypothetical protein